MTPMTQPGENGMGKERARAREVLAEVTERMAPAGRYVARDIRGGNMSAENERAIAAMLAFADEARLAERERICADIEDAIASGYPTPDDTCPHGEPNGEDCITCYDQFLTERLTAIRKPHP